MTDKWLAPGWTILSVGDIAKSIQYGHTASANEDSDGPRFLRITDIQNGQVNWAAVPSCSIEKNDIEKYRLCAGDIVFARTGATTGKSYLIRDCPDAVFASYLIRLRMQEGVIPAFVQAFFQTSNYWRQIEGGKRGIGQPNVNASILGTIRIPIAPTKEQQRIVAKIEELFSDLDAGVAALERAKAKLKRYRAAVLNAAIEGKLTKAWRAEHPKTEPASELLKRILTERRKKWEADQLAKYDQAGKEPPKNWKEKYVEPAPPDTSGLPDLPEGWCWAVLDAIADIVGGVTKDQKRSNQRGMREVPYLRVANVQRGYLDLAEMKAIAASEAEINELRLVPGDVLFTEGGDRDKLGRGWVWKGEIDECIHQNHIFRGRFFSGEMQSEFVSHHGNTFGKEWFIKAGKQTTNLASINLGILRRFPIPIPPAAEQVEIIKAVAERLSDCAAAETTVEHGLIRAARLRQSILKQAFEGKLVPQDPTDEPASVLVERVCSKQPADNHTPQPRPRARRRPNPQESNA